MSTPTANPPAAQYPDWRVLQEPTNPEPHAENILAVPVILTRDEGGVGYGSVPLAYFTAGEGALQVPSNGVDTNAAGGIITYPTSGAEQTFVIETPVTQSLVTLHRGAAPPTQLIAASGDPTQFLNGNLEWAAGTGFSIDGDVTGSIPTTAEEITMSGTPALDNIYETLNIKTTASAVKVSMTDARGNFVHGVLQSATPGGLSSSVSQTEASNLDATFGDFLKNTVSTVQGAALRNCSTGGGAFTGTIGANTVVDGAATVPNAQAIPAGAYFAGRDALTHGTFVPYTPGCAEVSGFSTYLVGSNNVKIGTPDGAFQVDVSAASELDLTARTGGVAMSGHTGITASASNGPVTLVTTSPNGTGITANAYTQLTLESQTGDIVATSVAGAFTVSAHTSAGVTAVGGDASLTANAAGHFAQLASGTATVTANHSTSAVIAAPTVSVTGTTSAVLSSTGAASNATLSAGGAGSTAVVSAGTASVTLTEDTTIVAQGTAIVLDATALLTLGAVGGSASLIPAVLTAANLDAYTTGHTYHGLVRNDDTNNVEVGPVVSFVSLRELKTAIAPLAAPENWLRQLQPVTFQYKKYPSTPASNGVPAVDRTRSGFIAEDVAQIQNIPEFVIVRDSAGKLSGINYDLFVAPLVAAFQDLDKRVAVIEGERKRTRDDPRSAPPPKASAPLKKA